MLNVTNNDNKILTDDSQAIKQLLQTKNVMHHFWVMSFKPRVAYWVASSCGHRKWQMKECNLGLTHWLLYSVP